MSTDAFGRPVPPRPYSAPPTSWREGEQAHRKPAWAEGNPLVVVRTCGWCRDQWWEHSHSVATTLEHMHERHPRRWARLATAMMGTEPNPR